MTTNWWYFEGGFYSEGTDAFAIFSNRRTLLISWAWILNLRYFKGLKLSQIRAWSSSEGETAKWSIIWAFKDTSDPCISWFEPFEILYFKIQAQENNKVCLFEE